MAIITSRTSETGNVLVRYEKCNSCGLCVQVCKDFSLKMVDGVPVVSNKPLFGCLACGHCMAVCPSGAIEISGREMSPEDRFVFSGLEKKTGYEQLKNLMDGRRSIRDFKDREIDADTIQKIIDAAKSAPMGLPPSDIRLIVLKGREEVRSFSFDVIDYFRKIEWLFSDRIVWMWRILGKETYQLMKSFAQPMVRFFLDTRKKGQNYLLYDAPLAIYFLASPYSDPADPHIAATYAMIAAESLGLGSCMIGSVHPMIQSGARKLKQKWNIPKKTPAGIIVIFGYPKFKFKAGIRRSFADVTFFGN